MAKQRQQNEAIVQLAERLFVQHWHPHSGSTTEHMAEMCLKAAEIFYHEVESQQGPRLSSELA